MHKNLYIAIVYLTVMPLGVWKQWLTQETVPLPFLLVTDSADVLGVQLFEKWTETLRENGEKVVQKVTNMANKWRSGRYYPFILRPAQQL